MANRLKLPRQNAKIRFASHLLDVTNRLVETQKGETTRLTKDEFEILMDILEANGNLVAREDFTPWYRQRTNPDRHPVDEHISHLRKKLGRNLFLPVPGVGYSLSPDIEVRVIRDATRSKADILESTAEKHTETHGGRDFLAVIKNCDDRIALGNANAETYVSKARAYLNAAHEGFCLLPWREAVEKAKRAIGEALARDDRFSSAYALRGMLGFCHDYEWQNAEHDLLMALELDPRSAMAHVFYAHFLISSGEFDKGLEYMRSGVELAPTDRITVSTECWMLVLSGQHYEAIKKGIEIKRLFPSFSPARIFLGYAYLADGDIDQAIEEFQAALEGEFLPEAVASLGHAYARLGRAKLALATLDQLDKAKAAGKIAYVPPYCRAGVLAGFGKLRKRECLDTLERAFKQRNSWLVYLNVDPRWDLLRKEPRFKDLVRRVGLTPSEN